MGKALLSCFHCGETVPANCHLTIQIEGQTAPVCCSGCEAVANLILQSGQSRYYEYRTAEALKPDDEDANIESAWHRFDDRQSLWGSALEDGRHELLLQVEGVRCAACAWLIRSQLEARDGIDQVQVDISTGFVRVNWLPGSLRLSKIAGILSGVGYRPHLPLAAEEATGRQLERRSALKRLAVAGLGMMQVMMYATALYAGDVMGISPGAERFLQWVSLLVTAPVLFYSGRVFYSSAWRSLKHAHVSMDVPVALAITIAFGMSCVNFLLGKGHVYFDSVVMFIFFLSLGRYAELMIRHRNLQTGLALARLLPEWAELVDGSEIERVPATDLKVGDRVRVKAGQAFPADGVVFSGETQANEALLTGESRPVGKIIGDKVIAGSINQAKSIYIDVIANPDDSTISVMGRMLLKSQTQRSEFTQLSERLAGWFVAAVLVVAALTASYWFFNDLDMLLPATLAVLVISCPCALSLATPAAVASSSRALLENGVLLTRGMALEELNQIDTVVFDKTGTLTSGKPQIAATVINPQRSDFDTDSALQLAALLESDSSHPLAGAFSALHLVSSPLPEVQSHDNGISASLHGHDYRIGNAAFADAPLSDGTAVLGSVWLADERSWIARFDMQDSLRTAAQSIVSFLQKSGLELVILSGDHPQAVASVADATGIQRWHAEQSPKMKMDLLHEMQTQGKKVLMVGDGINDAPVLASANVSMTVSGASELANSQADFILTGNSLASIRGVFSACQNTHRIIRQNLTWALSYNFLAVPFAAAGLVQPWVAALGMSISSLVVVMNSARLAKKSKQEPDSRKQPGVVLS
jgi:Cu2+-exporting ATPase